MNFQKVDNKKAYSMSKLFYLKLVGERGLLAFHARPAGRC